jgi:hypothetical protein
MTTSFAESHPQGQQHASPDTSRPSPDPPKGIQEEAAQAQPNVAPIGRHAMLTAEAMRVNDVVDYAKKFERAATPPKRLWVNPLGLLLIGASLGAKLGGQPFQGTVVWVLGIGVILVVMGHWIGEARTENLDALCHDFREYLERWPVVAGETPKPALSAEYERLVQARRKRLGPDATAGDRIRAFWRSAP